MPRRNKVRAQCIILIAGLFFIADTAFSQKLSEWNLRFKNYNAYTAAEDLPFWFHSNKFGIHQENSSELLLGINAYKEIQGNRLFDYGIGIETFGRISKNSDLFFNELFLEFKLNFINLYAGKKKYRDGLWKSDLSLGSMVWSGNAATMPKVMLYMPKFVSVPGTKDYLAFKSYLAHGWFGSDHYVKGAFLHEKAFYVRLLPHSFVANGYLGVIHNVQWGGTHPTVGKLPSSWNDYWKVFTGKAGEEVNSPGGEVVNALGNTVGAYEAMISLDFDRIDITAYRQFFIETSVSADLRSPWDGILGLQFDFRDGTSGWLDEFIWEYANTKKQNAKAGEEIGADGYYANFLYKDGWTYKGRIIGLPLVLLGEYNGRKQIVNNIILAHHFGLGGSFPVSAFNKRVSYEVRFTYSRNYGRTTNCINDFCNEGALNPLRTERKDQYYTEIQLGYNLSNRVRLWNNVGFDFGDLSEEFGILLGFTYALL